MAPLLKYFCCTNYIGVTNIIGYTHIYPRREIGMDHKEQVEQVHDLFRRLIELVLGRMAEQWNEQNLSLAQISLLFVLAHTETASVGQVAERLHIGQSAASLLVDRLVQANLAERSEDPQDRRRAIVRLTGRGESLMGRNMAGSKYLHAWLNEQDDERLAMLIDTITLILDIQRNNRLEEKS
jgi:MarR family transcriptional regulator, organic hydroperoxide resistance regulator